MFANDHCYHAQHAYRPESSVARVRGGGELGIRIREMGIVPGTEIEIIGHAPLKDPVHIKIYGNHLTLRNNEADHIMVDAPSEN